MEGNIFISLPSTASDAELIRIVTASEESSGVLSAVCETAASDEDASDEDGEDEETVPAEQEAADTASVKARNSEPSF